MDVYAEKLQGRHQAQGEAPANCTCMKMVEAPIEAVAKAIARVMYRTEICNSTVTIWTDFFVRFDVCAASLTLQTATQIVFFTVHHFLPRTLLVLYSVLKYFLIEWLWSPQYLQCTRLSFKMVVPNRFFCFSSILQSYSTLGDSEITN